MLFIVYFNLSKYYNCDFNQTCALTYAHFLFLRSGSTPTEITALRTQFFTHHNQQY